MVHEGCGAVCRCVRRELQIINFPVDQIKKMVWTLGGEIGEGYVFSVDSPLDAMTKGSSFHTTK